MGRHPILIGTQNPATQQAFYRGLKEQFPLASAASGAEVLEKLKKRRHEFAFVDLSLLTAIGGSTDDPAAAVRRIRQDCPNVHLVVLAGPDQSNRALKALEAGADHYLTHPIGAEEVRYAVQSLTESSLRQSELDYLRDQFWFKDDKEVVRTRNQSMHHVFEAVKLVAPTKSTVLLTGDTGTGKSMIAKLIHRHSHRRDKQFITVHCGAVPDTLIESELFGHERGAFTGASKRKLGKFDLARFGTIFLDEIGTISPAVQVKLLQVLQEKTYQRVGGESSIQADVRIIAATNENLEDMVARGAFRSDLFFRLKVFPIHIPPLAARKEDIPLLVDVFIERFNREHLKEIKGAQPEVLEALARYDWPGNVRELENVIERAYIIETADQLTPDSFPAEFFDNPDAPTPTWLDDELTLAEIKQNALEQAERQYLERLLVKHNGSINKTAANAGITTRQVHKLMTKFGLKKEQFKKIRRPA